MKVESRQQSLLQHQRLPSPKGGGSIEGPTSPKIWPITSKLPSPKGGGSIEGSPASPEGNGRLPKLPSPKGGGSIEAYITGFCALTKAAPPTRGLTPPLHLLVPTPDGCPRKCGNGPFSAIRARHTVRFLYANDFFRAMTQIRLDNSMDLTLHSFSSPNLLILDDLDLHRVTACLRFFRSDANSLTNPPIRPETHASQLNRI